MIAQFKIRWFRCFREVDVELRPLTVLIGPNDSGKSAFLTALQYVVEGRATKEPNDLWMRQDSGTLIIRARGAFGVLSCEWKNQSSSPEGARAAMRSVSLFKLPSAGLMLHCPGSPDTGDPPQIEPTGENLPALLDHLLRRHRQRFERLVDALKARVAGLEEIEIGTPSPDRRSIDLRLAADLRLPAPYLSVGVRHLLFYLALAFHPSPPSLVLIEEPENGIHPKRLADLVSLLRGLTQGMHGAPPAQVILATHSPYLLDHIDLATDQVLVFKREDDGSRSVSPVDPERLESFLHHSMLGEVWSLEGEEGMVKQAHA